MSSKENMKFELRRLRFAVESLSVYRNLTKDRVIEKFCCLVDSLIDASPSLLISVSAYNDLCYEILSADRYCSLKNYIIDKIVFDENRFSIIAHNRGLEAINPVLIAAAKNDLTQLQYIADFSPLTVKRHLMNRFSEESFGSEIIENLPAWSTCEHNAYESNNYPSHISSVFDQLLHSCNWAECIEVLARFHHTYGSGIFPKYKAFVWKHGNGKGCLEGVKNPDPITLKDLIGYETERSEVINNTKQFLQGFPSNNVLLYGDRGTGKSSTVKALLNEFHSEGLRIVEIPKKHLIEFPEVIRILSERNLKFIVFIDDLAFEDSEEIYTSLKAVLEGGVESRPGNVIIYATSNRRHLIKEKFSDRAGLQSINPEDEVRASDTIQEKLSLSDRFGITIVFSSPDKYRFLEIVDGIVLRRGLKVDKEYLHKEALKWELWYNGRSPRTARQFVDWLEGELAQK